MPILQVILPCVHSPSAARRRAVTDEHMVIFLLPVQVSDTHTYVQRHTMNTYSPIPTSCLPSEVIGLTQRDISYLSSGSRVADCHGLLSQRT